MKRSLGTHDGTFHGDEVTACALLLLFDQIDKDKIFRTRDPEKLQGCEYVCDVGGIYEPAKKRFDHHQSGYQGEMSSAGMVWKDFHQRGIVDEATYEYFNRSLIQGIDAHDNGKTTCEEGTCSISHVISNFVPIRYDAVSEEQDAAFFQAVDFVWGHLGRLLERFRYINSCREKVRDAMKERKKFLLFDEPLPWMESFFELGGEEHPALFVVMPSGGHWKVRGIPPNGKERMKVRLPLPHAWAGLLEAELKRVSGIRGAMFCHKGRFISVWETKEDAMRALEMALKQEKS